MDSTICVENQKRPTFVIKQSKKQQRRPKLKANTAVF